jgi:thiol-disulfide isomerase/thioredoxin
MPHGSTTTLAQATLFDSASAPFTRRLPQVGLNDSTLQVWALTPVEGKRLSELLRVEVAKASKMGLTPIVEFGATWCAPCRAIETSMRIPVLRDAFKYMYVIRLDRDVWASYLNEAGFAPSGLPAFYGLGRDARPNGLVQDGIEGDMETISKGDYQKVASDAAPALATFFAKCREQFSPKVAGGKGAAGGH